MRHSRNRRSSSVLLTIAVLALMGCQTTGNLRTGPSPNPITKESPMTVLSFNIRLGIGQEGAQGDIYHLNWGQNLGDVIEAIRSVDPDVVGLQEVAGVGQIKEIAETLNMNYAFEWHGTGSSREPWWGVGVLSKYRIVATEGVEISSGRADTKSILIANLDAAGRKLTAISVHKDKDLNDGSSIANILNALPDSETPVILIGDFNIEPDKSRLIPLTRRFQDTARSVDTATTSVARERGTFYWSGRRIDYVFADKGHFRVVNAGLVPEKHHDASDHIAYYAKLIWAR